MAGDGLEKSVSVDLEMHFRALESMYLSAPLNVFYQPTIRVWDAGAEISILVEEKFFHSGGAMHGSVYFKMLDDAAFFAANSVEHQYFVLTADFRIDLLRPCTGGVITSKGSIVRAGRQDILAESKLYDAQDRLLATGIGRFSRGRTLLAESDGYAGHFRG